jgi:hypothetical protein
VRKKKKWMISVASAGLSFALLAGLVGAQDSAAPKKGDSCERKTNDVTDSKHQSPFACDRMALDPVARKRHFDELGPALREARKAVRELPNGYEFQFSPDPKTVAMVAEWAAAERVCCPFFNIELRMEPEGGPFWLRLTGRKGTKEFIKVDGSSWIKTAS